jgi:hypothetical protein
MKFLVLGSHCKKSDYYQLTVQRLLDTLSPGQLVEKTIDLDIIKSYGIKMGCSMAYCPGCNYAHPTSDPSQYTPALVIDDHVVFHTSFPTEEAFREKLKQYI